MTKAAVHSKAVVLLLLIRCLLLPPLFVGVLCLILVLLCSTLVSYFSVLGNHLDGEERAGCFALSS